MTLSLIWAGEAIEDLDEITEYIAQRNVAVAERLEDLSRILAVQHARQQYP